MEATIRFDGYDPSEFYILSRKDSPKLKTIDDIMAILPTSVSLVVLDDVEHLLAEEQQTPTNVKRMQEQANIRYMHRRLTLVATITIPGLPGRCDRVTSTERHFTVAEIAAPVEVEINRAAATRTGYSANLKTLQ